MVFGGLVDFPHGYPQLVDNRVEKAEFYTGKWDKVCGFFQKIRRINVFWGSCCLKKAVLMWKTEIQLCEQLKVSEMFPHIPVDRRRGFSTEKRTKNFHNDKFCGLVRANIPFFAVARVFSQIRPHVIPRRATGRRRPLLRKKLVVQRHFHFPQFPPSLRILLLVFLRILYVFSLVVRRARASLRKPPYSVTRQSGSMTADHALPS